jgi:hypothetical protein
MAALAIRDDIGSGDCASIAGKLMCNEVRKTLLWLLSMQPILAPKS